MTGFAGPLPAGTMIPFLRYLFGTAVAGTVGGAVHGAARGWRELRADMVGTAGPLTQTHLLKYIVEPVITDSTTAGIMAPWAPVILPLWLFVWEGNRCPNQLRLRNPPMPE